LIDSGDDLRHRRDMNTSKVMLITGGSRGIGAATARLAAERGYSVCINYRQNAQAAHALVRDLEATGAKITAVQADVSIEIEVMRLFETIDRTLGTLSVLINNAGMLEPQSSVASMSAERISRVLSTNVTGSFLCAREAVLRMSTRRGGEGGSIVNVSSMAARLGSPNEYVDYAAAKGAIDTFTVGLAKEVAADGIRVNAVRPGLIYTDMHASGGEPGRIERLKDSVPLKRGGQPDEVASAILWLASGQASYVTGTFIDVSGGR
jgi:NAD(P)-dependent dehydrogenase (short-subunit alcohol dehydrogenase family)